MQINAKISTKPFPGLRLKTISVVLLFVFLVTQKVFSQFTEDFSDGEFSSNPSWVGSTGDFVVNDVLQLQLNAGAAGTSWLSTPIPPWHSGRTEWEFLIKQSFAPSSGNFGRFYLTSDQEDLGGPLNGYYLQFGEAGSEDAVELFRQSGSTRKSICRAVSGQIATPFELRVLVSSEPGGEWKLFIDYAGGRDFVLEGSGFEPATTSSSYSGFLCTYTITNATRFYLDEITIRHVNSPDTSPPDVLSLKATSSQSLEVIFSEDVDATTAQNVLNYFVSPATGNPFLASLRPDQRTVELTFSESFKNGELSSLAVTSIADISGNKIDQTLRTFLFFQDGPLSYRDIIVTEFCADPSPPLGLPEAEFIEVYNRGKYPVDLTGWELSDEVTGGKSDSIILLPGKYLIMTAPINVAKFSVFGHTVQVSPFPSLNNSGDVITLKNKEGRIIDSLHYDLSWYGDSDKSEGGWTLERIDMDNICAEESNWTSSEAQEGGTPGKQNSINANKPDSAGPRVLSAALVSPTLLMIQFDEKLEPIVPTSEQFIVNPPVQIHSISFLDGSLASLVLYLTVPVQPNKSYSLQVLDVYDCPGNKIQQTFSTAEFILPTAATPGDVLINEILFNPRSTGVDFVEIYNHSEKTIDLSNWTYRNAHAGYTPFPLTEKTNLLIRAHEYKVFTGDPNILKGEYIAGKEGTFHETDLPPLNDEEGAVSLMDGNGTIIDSMSYDKQMHVPFIKDVEGVSLERISFSESAWVLSNWRSASSVSGFATPGYVNSNARRDSPGDGAVTVVPEVIQPMAGTGDFAQINYHFDNGGGVANVKIFDQQGRPIREIAENQLLGTEGFFRWEGDFDNGTKASMGYYMVWFEVFNADGNVQVFKKRVAVF